MVDTICSPARQTKNSRGGEGDEPCDNLTGHTSIRIGVLSCESEISNLEGPVCCNQQIVRLHILETQPISPLLREDGDQ